MMILKKLNLHFCLEESVSMKVNLIILFLLYSYVGLGQERYYTDPVKIPILLSGTFAELRSNHFHSGIDIKTQGQTGFPVYSVADGFISRIVVSPTGYGRALYISHPNGTTSVYGHLESFREDIEEFVKTHQYNQKSFRVDIQLLPGRFQLKKNEQIALTGNSGSSGGPHLHFEVRVGENSYQATRNPLLWLYPFPDRGVVAGRIANSEGQALRNVPLLLRRIDATSAYAETTTYADNSVHPDDRWQENFAFDDVVAGYYELTVGQGSKKVKHEFWVYPYQTNMVEIIFDN